MLRTLMDNSLLKLEIDFAYAAPQLQLSLYSKMSVGLFKYIDTIILEDILITLGSLGYKKVHVELEDSKDIKLAKMLGFEELHDKGGVVTLVQDIL